jgi:hypothetical protein
VRESQNQDGIRERRALCCSALCLEVKALTVKLLGTQSHPIAIATKPQNHYLPGSSAKREETTIRTGTHKSRSGIANFRNFLCPFFKPLRSDLMTIRHKIPQL